LNGNVRHTYLRCRPQLELHINFPSRRRRRRRTWWIIFELRPREFAPFFPHLPRIIAPLGGRGEASDDPFGLFAGMRPTSAREKGKNETITILTYSFLCREKRLLIPVIYCEAHNALYLPPPFLHVFAVMVPSSFLPSPRSRRPLTTTSYS